MTVGKELICEVPFVFHLRALSDLYNTEYKKLQEYAITPVNAYFYLWLAPTDERENQTCSQLNQGNNLCMY